LFVPAVVLLVPLYLIVLHPPIIGAPIINTFWAVWLPAGANAFNILLVTRFFNNLPREVFEAAKTDGAGPFRLFWSIVLPMSRPILGVVSVFAIINAWKDYLWPSLVLANPAVQPLSVRLPLIQPQIELDVFLAALAISTLIPIVLFLVFQGMFLRSAGLGGAVKG
jgi:multiple sugar transport system permease protein